MDSIPNGMNATMHSSFCSDDQRDTRWRKLDIEKKGTMMLRESRTRRTGFKLGLHSPLRALLIWAFKIREDATDIGA